MSGTLEQTLTTYDVWLDRQRLSAKTCTAYLAQRPPAIDNPLYTPFARYFAIRGNGTYLKAEKTKQTSDNLMLSAIDHFHQSLGNDQIHTPCESLPTLASRLLKMERQKAFFVMQGKYLLRRGYCAASLLRASSLCRYNLPF